MAAGLGLLRLSPDAFWALTLPEFALAIRGALGLPLSGTGVPDPNALAALMQRYPDERQS
jgi:uncharacterized phage protein (TIGR02216 family)